MTNPSKLLEFMNSIDPMAMFEAEPIKDKTYKADGWVYRDIGRSHPKTFDKLISIVGPDNIVALVTSSGGSGEQSWIRGQFLVSPDGIRRVTEWKQTQTAD